MFFTIYGVILTLFGIYTHFSNTERDTGQQSIRDMFKDQQHWLSMRYLVWFGESFLALAYMVFFILAVRPENYVADWLSYIAIFMIVYEIGLVILRYVTTTKSLTIDTFVDKTILLTKKLLWMEWFEKGIIMVFVFTSLN